VKEAGGGAGTAKLGGLRPSTAARCAPRASRRSTRGAARRCGRPRNQAPRCGARRAACAPPTRPPLHPSIQHPLPAWRLPCRRVRPPQSVRPDVHGDVRRAPRQVPRHGAGAFGRYRRGGGERGEGGRGVRGAGADHAPTVPPLSPPQAGSPRAPCKRWCSSSRARPRATSWSGGRLTCTRTRTRKRGPRRRPKRTRPRSWPRSRPSSARSRPASRSCRC